METPERKQGVVYVYNQDFELIAKFGEELQTANGARTLEGLSEEAMRNQMVAPTIHIEQNGTSTFSFQMLANSAKWQEIKDARNFYYVNGRYYTALTDSAYEYSGEDTARVVTVTLVETWYLLKKHYNQAYNCGIYAYAKAAFKEWVNDGAVFTINRADCSNSGDTITVENAWAQVKNWVRTDTNDNVLSYAILTDDKHKPTNWDDAPSAVAIKSFVVDGDTATMTIETRVNATVKQVFQYKDSGSYQLTDQDGNNLKPIPNELVKVTASVTTVTEDANGSTVYKTADQEVEHSYNSSKGTFTISTSFGSNKTVNSITAEYKYNYLGNIKEGATCTFAYGAEVVDEHTFVILPKANEKYKLTIDGVEYEDSQVTDSRGVVMPRGSGGYAMWAALKNSGWTLGICDVIATDFDPTIDYGVFNVETDMQDTLSNIQSIQSLYGGILDWDSERKRVNYRAENSKDYQSYEDGFNDWTGYVFREGKNFTDAPTITYDNDIITKAYILGYGNLNIRAVNDGKSYIENHSYSNEVYEGYLTQELIYDTNDEGGQNQLKYWGEKELAKQCKPRKTIAISATDVRTTAGMEHEVFDINDVVKVYYHDSQDNSEVEELQRIILWEYDVFAMWDCTVELGDKTKNEVDLFKLVYNKSLSSPDTNGSGEISSNQITFSVSDGTYDQNTLAGQLQYLSQATTANTQSIADIVIQTNNYNAQMELFTLYQKQVDGLFTQTYAGLQLYADDKVAAAVVSARKYTDDVAGTINESIAEVEALVDESGTAIAILRSKVNDVEAYVETIATVDGKAQVHMSGDVFIDSGKSFYYGGGDYGSSTRVGWTAVFNANGTHAWSVLGKYGQDSIYLNKVPGYFG